MTPNKGNLTKDEKWIVGTTYAATNRTYNTTYGLMLTETNPNNKTTSYVYDASSLYPTTLTNHLNQATAYTYDYRFGKVLQTTDPNNSVYQNSYDGFGRVLTEVIPDPAGGAGTVTKTTFAYTDSVNAFSVYQKNYLNASLFSEVYVYLDGLGREIQVRKPTESAGSVAVSDTVYDSDGRVAKKSLPYWGSGTAKTVAQADNNYYTIYTYDSLDRVTFEDTSVGDTTTSYGTNTITITDPRGKLKDIIYDAFGRVASVGEHSGASTYTTVYTYDGNGSLTNITDALGNVRNFTYDGLSRRLTAQDLHATTDGTFGTYTYTYDGVGNLLTKLDPIGSTTTYVYDALNRLSTEDNSGLAGVEVTNTYDTCTKGVGRLCSTANASSAETLTYNNLGYIASSTKTISATPYATSTTYDRQGNPLIITNPDGSQVQNIYNNRGLLEKTQRKESGGVFTDVVFDYDYSPTEAITNIDSVNNVRTTNTYDPAKRWRLTNKLTQFQPSGTKFQDLAYTYDNNGNITKIVDNSQTDSKKTVNYTYDDLNRLLTATATLVAAGQQTYIQTFTYDALGNILTRAESTGGGPTTTYTYTYAGHTGSNWANPHAVTSIGNGTTTQNFVYDKNGNLLSQDGGTTLPWYTSGSSVPWYSGAGGTWTDRKQLVVQESQIPGTTALTNYPLLVSVTDPDLKTVANGGKVGKTDGSDILFTLDNSTKLSHQIEKYVPTTGELVAWVKIPSLSATANTTIYSYFGNASAPDQQDSANVFESSYKGVWHYKEDPSGTAPQMKDTTSNANHGTSVGSMTTTDLVNAKVGSGLDFDGADDAVNNGSAANLDNMSAITAEAWIYNTQNQPESFGGRILDKRSNSGTGWTFLVNPTNNLKFYVEHNTTPLNITSSNNTFALNTWQHVAVTWDGSTSAGNVKIYVNGQEVTYQLQQSGAGARKDDAAQSLYAGECGTWAVCAYKGILDELKVSNVVRSGDWIKTGYNNQNSPSTFHTWGAVSGGGTWTNRKQITVDKTKVSGGSDLTNFPMLVSVTDTELKHTGSGGFVGKTDGTDIVFTSADGTTKLSHEIEKYVPTTGELVAWVKVPVLSVTVDTKVVVYYGNVGAADQQDKVNVWDSNFKGVWHLPENPTGSAPQMKESTSSAYHGTSNGGQMAGDSQAGKIANALSFDGSNDYIDVGAASGVNGLTNNLTVSAWIKPNSLTGVRRVVSPPRTLSNNGYAFGTNGTDLRFTTYNVKDYDITGTGLATGTWQRVDAVMSSNNVTFYLNGVNKGTVTHTSGGNANTDDSFRLGASTPTGSASLTEIFQGLIDEVRISNTARTAGWIGTEYNNQNSPSTFYTLGPVTSGTDTFSWDYNNRLTSSTTAGTTLTYGYDPAGQRVRLSKGSTNTVYPTKLYNTDGTSVYKHIFAGDMLVGDIKGSGAGATPYYVHTDHLTGSSVVTTGAGIQEELMDYFPYGNIRLDTKAGSFNEQRKYAGSEFDVDSGLNYMNARYYSSKIARFLSHDPIFWTHSFVQIKDPQSWNAYAYARNNPLRHIDPNGKWFLDVVTGKQSWNDFTIEVGDAASYLYNNSGAWQTAMNHPYATGAVVGAVGGAAAVGAVAAAPTAGAYLTSTQALTGAAANVTGQALQDMTSGQFSGVGSYTVSAFSGAAGGSVKAGAIMQGGIAASSNYLQQKASNTGSVDWKSVAISGGSAAVSSKVMGVRSLNGLSSVNRSVGQSVLSGMIETPVQVINIGVQRPQGFVGPIKPQAFVGPVRPTENNQKKGR